MKKIIFTLVVLLLAVPASAEVLITCVEEANGVVSISYDASGESELPRAFALDIQLIGSAVIVDVNDNVNAYYTVHPGTIQIDENGTVTDDGTAVADDDPKCGVVGANCITIEMGSLYVGAANAPPDTGELIKIEVDSNCDVEISGNAIRGDIVLEDVTVADVNAPGCSVIGMDCDPGVNPTLWETLGKPDAWCCPGQADGDNTGDGSCNVLDLFGVKRAYGTNYATAPHGTANGEYNCAADGNHDGNVNVLDLFNIKNHYGTIVYSPGCNNDGDDINMTCD